MKGLLGCSSPTVSITCCCSSSSPSHSQTLTSKLRVVISCLSINNLCYLTSIYLAQKRSLGLIGTPISSTCSLQTNCTLPFCGFSLYSPHLTTTSFVSVSSPTAEFVNKCKNSLALNLRLSLFYVYISITFHLMPFFLPYLHIPKAQKITP